MIGMTYVGVNPFLPSGRASNMTHLVLITAAHFKATIALACVSHLPYVGDVWHTNANHPGMLWIMDIIQKG
jgi:hypothetical protein